MRGNWHTRHTWEQSEN